MNSFGNFFKPLMWSMALLLTAFVAGCGGGGGGGSGGGTGAGSPSPTVPGPGTGVGGLGQGPASVNLGTAGNFVILAKTGISTVPGSAITGNLGVSPAVASFITGFTLSDPPTTFSTSAQVTGQVFAANYDAPTPDNLTTAVSNMETAYTDAAGRPAGVGPFLNLGGGTVAGRTLVPGVYTWGSNVTITTDLTLSGGANDVWIFQISGTLDLEDGNKVLLTGGALPQNIFWQVADVVTLKAGTQFKGIILAQTNIAMVTNASTIGRLLAQTEVALDQNTVTQP